MTSGFQYRLFLEEEARLASWARNTARQRKKKANRAAAELKRALMRSLKNPINPNARVPQVSR